MATGAMRGRSTASGSMAEVWGQDAETPGDCLDAEIYDHWLEPA